MPLERYKTHEPQIDKTVFIAPNAYVIGDVKIGAQSSIWYGCTVRGDVNDIKIGSGTNIQDGTVIHVSSTLQGTYIGDNVTIGHGALIHACSIDEGAFIGMRACIMDGAHIEAGAMVAAGALVTPGKIVKSGELWAGSPAKLMRALSEQDQEHMQASAVHYVRLAHDYLDGKTVIPPAS